MTLVAVACWLLIVLLPGVAILRLLRTPVSLAQSVALAAPIGLAVIDLAGLAASRFGAGVISTCLTTIGVVLAGWLAVEAVRWRRGAVAAADDPNRRDEVVESAALTASSSATWPDHSLECARLLLVCAVGAGVVLWSLLHSQLSVPAGWDAMHHGYFVRQIVEYDTLKQSIVQSSDAATADSTSSFYPLAMDLVAAMLHVLFGFKISTLVLAMTTAFAGVVLPLGSYVLCRCLAPGLPLAAGFAAVASVLPALLFTIEYTGRVTAIVGVALVPCTVAMMLVIGRRRGWRLGALGVLCVVALIEVHTSELPIVAGMLVAIALVGTSRSRDRLVWPMRLGYFAAVAAVAVGVLLVADPGMRYMSSQRSGWFGAAHPAPFSLSAGINALKDFVALPSPYPPATNLPSQIWGVLASLGCLCTLLPRWRPLMGMAVAYLGFGAFYVAWRAGGLQPVAFLGDPWYRSSQRMLWELLVLGAVPVGVALATAAVALRTALSRLAPAAERQLPRPRLALAMMLISVALVTAATAAFTAPPAPTVSRWLRTYVSPVGGGSRAAFSYLAAHVGKDGRVFDDMENHGDLWLYADYNVPTLFGNPPLIGQAPTSWKQRLYLRAELGHIASDGCIAHLLATYNVEYLYYSKDAMFAGRPRISLHTLQDRRYFRKVFSDGPATIYRIEAPPLRPCLAAIDTKYSWNNPATAN
jgi:hypothetical protein